MEPILAGAVEMAARLQNLQCPRAVDSTVWNAPGVAYLWWSAGIGCSGMHCAKKSLATVNEDVLLGRKLIW